MVGEILDNQVKYDFETLSHTKDYEFPIQINFQNYFPDRYNNLGEPSGNMLIEVFLRKSNFRMNMIHTRLKCSLNRTKLY